VLSEGHTRMVPGHCDVSLSDFSCNSFRLASPGFAAACDKGDRIW
jgi:hypothetical protein